MIFGAALALMQFEFPSHHPRASYPMASKRKADPKKKAARKRQKKARMISRGRL